MQGSLENQQISDKNALFDLSVLTVLGDRPDQQDSFGYELRDREGMITVCDGMGGLDGGRQAGRLTVQTLLDNYRQTRVPENPSEFLIGCAHQAGRRVRGLTDAQGKPVRAGSTLVSVLIREQQLDWISVGDSRGYLIRNGEYVQFTLDHNYDTVLQEQRSAGVISPAEYEQRKENAEALISYIGIDQLQLIDYSRQPIRLLRDDKILIMSDGLYKLADNEEIFRVVDNFSSIEEALQALELKARKNARQKGISRDNMTVALIRIH